MKISTGRQRDAQLIRQANRAAAVGRLFLGEIRNWQEFLDADTVDLEGLPRRQLKSGRADARDRLSQEIKAFCSRNFEGMTQSRLSKIYEEIKAYRGIELPLVEFEPRFARVRREVLQGSPTHSTVCVSLWGLQYGCSTEHELAKDVLTGPVSLCVETQAELKKYEGLGQYANCDAAMTKLEFFCEKKASLRGRGHRVSLNLIEAYLNGLAWDFIRVQGTNGLSDPQEKSARRFVVCVDREGSC